MGCYACIEVHQVHIWIETSFLGNMNTLCSTMRSLAILVQDGNDLFFHQKKEYSIA